MSVVSLESNRLILGAVALLLFLFIFVMVMFTVFDNQEDIQENKVKVEQELDDINSCLLEDRDTFEEFKTCVKAKKMVRRFNE